MALSRTHTPLYLDADIERVVDGVDGIGSRPHAELDAVRRRRFLLEFKIRNDESQQVRRHLHRLLKSRHLAERMDRG